MGFNTSFFGDEFHHAGTSPRFGQVDCVYNASRVGNANNGCANGITRCLHDEFFTDRHDLAVVAECLVQLHHGELGVVACADAFVAEHATNFVDALHAANDESLEVKFKRDAQVQLHVK